MPAPRRYRVRAGGRASGAGSRRVRPPRLSGPARPASAFGEAARPPPAPPPPPHADRAPSPRRRTGAGAGRAAPGRWVPAARQHAPVPASRRRSAPVLAEGAPCPGPLLLHPPITAHPRGWSAPPPHKTQDPSSPQIHRAGGLDHTWRPRKPLCQLKNWRKSVRSPPHKHFGEILGDDQVPPSFTQFLRCLQGTEPRILVTRPPMLCLPSSTQCGAWGPERTQQGQLEMLAGEPAGLSSLSRHRLVEPPPRPVGRLPKSHSKGRTIQSSSNQVGDCAIEEPSGRAFLFSPKYIRILFKWPVTERLSEPASHIRPLW